MKSFTSIRIVKVGSGFIAIKEKFDELWLEPDDKVTYFQQYDLDYKLRDLLQDEPDGEEDNATE